jgi:two-component system, LytTR family, response regulator
MSPKIYAYDDKILFNIGKKFELYSINNIKYIITDRPYTYIKLSDGNGTTTRKSLSLWESKLPETHFIRIHQSTIINIEYLRNLRRERNSYFAYLTEENSYFPVSRRYSKRIKALIP